MVLTALEVRGSCSRISEMTTAAVVLARSGSRSSPESECPSAFLPAGEAGKTQDSVKRKVTRLGGNAREQVWHPADTVTGIIIKQTLNARKHGHAQKCKDNTTINTTYHHNHHLASTLSCLPTHRSKLGMVRMSKCVVVRCERKTRTNRWQENGR